MFSSALRRTDISPVGRSPEQDNTTPLRIPVQSRSKTTYENVEKLLQEADSLKSQMQLRSDLNRRDVKDWKPAFNSSCRYSVDRPGVLELREITNSPAVDVGPKTMSVKHFKEDAGTRSDPYKLMYDKAVAQHATDKQLWAQEKDELLRRIQRLESTTAPHSPVVQKVQPQLESPHQVYLSKINREIEELKDRVRKAEQQNESIRTRSRPRP
jgi:hypothetical protein